MIFDLFHSISDPVVNGFSIGPKKTLEQFLSQAVLAENLGMDTVWLAESHFSSETQKKTSVATIPEFFGEVGLNCDSFQFFHLLVSRTKKINLGTGIHNIVGGSGGPIASAERVNMLHFINQGFWEGERTLRMGISSGRFPYQNTPFGIIPRNEFEKDFWPLLKRLVFLEALEIFLRLIKGEEVASQMVQQYEASDKDLEKELKATAPLLKTKYTFPVKMPRRWEFEVLKLTPKVLSKKGLNIVLGSSDPEALSVANKYWDVDLFNLSFTPPDKIEKLHETMRLMTKVHEGIWHRSRLPRTVMIFIDPDRKKANELASQSIDTYIEAMRGTAQVPDKNVLLQRALIGDASEIRDQLLPENPRCFSAEDRLMLWFEFNQLDGKEIEKRMRYFSDEVIGKL